MKPRILTVAEYYLPGYRGGGPIRTLANMVDRLADRWQFLIVTRDRDQGEPCRYPGLGSRVWQRVGAGLVHYLAPAQENPWRLARLARRTPHDLLYLNSFFASIDVQFLLLRRFGLLPRRPVVLATRGEFAPAALAIKAAKKQWYLHIGARLGLWRDVRFQASSDHEAADLRRVFGDRAPITVAMDLPPLPPAVPPARAAKRPGRLRVVFLSRLAPIKNLDGALAILAALPPPSAMPGAVADPAVEFDIFGPREDLVYWEKCAALIRRLPPWVRAEYRGVMPGDRVREQLAGYHLLLLPSKGENFGHVIIEALQAGCLALISDRTPWRDLATPGVGAALSLADPAAFTAFLARVLAMDDSVWAAASQRARDFGRAAAEAPAILADNIRLFSEALDGARGS